LPLFFKKKETLKSLPISPSSSPAPHRTRRNLRIPLLGNGKMG